MAVLKTASCWCADNFSGSLIILSNLGGKSVDGLGFLCSSDVVITSSMIGATGMKIPPLAES